MGVGAGGTFVGVAAVAGWDIGPAAVLHAIMERGRLSAQASGADPLACYPSRGEKRSGRRKRRPQPRWHNEQRKTTWFPSVTSHPAGDLAIAPCHKCVTAAWPA
jgi:outer membrane receptor for ferric coprogen and ferric-rhodotorulic acid